MSELTPILDRSVVNPYTRIAPNVMDPSVVAEMAVDPVMMEDVINRLERMTKQVGETSQANPDVDANRPQLALPVVTLTNGEDDVESLEKMQTILEQARSGYSMESLKARLEAMQRDGQLEQAEADKRWLAFEVADANLKSAQSQVEEAILLLDKLSANSAPTPTERDDAEAVANQAFAKMTSAMDELNNAINALIATDQPERLDAINKMSTKLNGIEELMSRLQMSMQDSQLTVMDEQSKLYIALKESMQKGLIIKADEFAEKQKTREKLFTATKWLGFILMAAVTLLTGGSGGWVMAAISVALVVADLATDGKVTGTLMKPITDAIGWISEKIVKGITDAMVKAGYSESAASITATVVAVLVIVVVVVAATIGGYKYGGNILKAVLSKVGEYISKFAAAFPNLANFFKAGYAILEKGFAMFEDTLRKMLTGMADLLVSGASLIHKNFGAFLEKMIEGLVKSITEHYFNFMMISQTILMGVSAVSDAAVSSAAAFIDKQAKDISAGMALAQADHEIISNKMTELSETYGKLMAKSDQYYQRITELIASKRDAVLDIHKKMLLRA